MNKGKARRERKLRAEIDRRIERGYSFGKRSAERGIAERIERDRQQLQELDRTLPFPDPKDKGA